jgi:hypothetical protein
LTIPRVPVDDKIWQSDNLIRHPKPGPLRSEPWHPPGGCRHGVLPHRPRDRQRP